MADGQQAIERLQQEFVDAVLSTGQYENQYWATVDVRSIPEICQWLRDEASMAYNYLVDVTAVHWPDDPKPFELVYHLYSFERDDRLRLKTRIGDGDTAPSLTGLWKSALWNERETYDMFGIRFEGHPDLRRILMPDDYTDYPLRKEFPLYRG